MLPLLFQFFLERITPVDVSRASLCICSALYCQRSRSQVCLARFSQAVL